MAVTRQCSHYQQLMISTIATIVLRSLEKGFILNNVYASFSFNGIFLGGSIAQSIVNVADDLTVTGSLPQSNICMVKYKNYIHLVVFVCTNMSTIIISLSISHILLLPVWSKCFF